MIIFFGILDDVQPHIRDSKDATSTWKKLQQVFA